MHTYMHACIHTYIYIYRERERDHYIYTHTHVGDAQLLLELREHLGDAPLRFAASACMLPSFRVAVGLAEKKENKKNSKILR